MEMTPIVPGTRRQRSARSVMKSRVASMLCFIPALYLGAVVFFALWNAKDFASAQPQFLRYVLVPALLAVPFVATGLFGSRVARVTLGGSGIAVLVGLVFCEARLESRYVSALFGLADVPSHGAMEVMETARGLPPAYTVEKLNREIGAPTLDTAVLSGMPGERVFLCSHQGQPVVYKADRYGFRNPDAVYDKPVDRLLLGDSFVEGICLPDGSDLVGQVRARGGNVVGAGIRGAGPMMELAMLGRFGPAIRPRQVVIVFYEGNDWENLGHEVKYAWLRGALHPDARFGPATMPDAMRTRSEAVIQRWASVARPTASWALTKGNVLRNSLALHQTWTQLGLGYPKAARDLPLYSRILARSRQLVEGWGGRLAILYVPQTSRYSGLLRSGFVYDQVRSRVADAARQNHIPVVDLTTHFAGQPDPLALYAADGHLSVQGAKLAAAVLDRSLGEGARP